MDNQNQSKNLNANNKFQIIQTIQNFWNDHIMEQFIKANLFMVCCIAAGLLLIVYLGAFSCEVSWILEAHGELPFGAYFLCTQYFVVFVATTILIHGLVTGLPWGLFAWSIAIGLLSIPELVFVMIMTTQHWGLQSIHGLVELIAYLGRLVINCFALICVIPTAIRWRRETQVLTQLQDLATRLQLQTPPPSGPVAKVDTQWAHKQFSQPTFDNSAFDFANEQLPLAYNNDISTQAHKLHNLQNLKRSHHNNLFGSQNEFDASLFTTAPYVNNYKNDMIMQRNRTQSLLDLRCTLPGMYNPRHAVDTEDKNAKYFNISIDDLKQNLRNSSPLTANQTNSNDPIYCSIEPVSTPTPERHSRNDDKRQSYRNMQTPTKKLRRNCISLQNLDDITKVQKELENALAMRDTVIQHLSQAQQFYMPVLPGQPYPMPNLLYRQPGLCSPRAPMLAPHNPAQLQYFSGFGYANYTNPYITANSKLSLSNESDDYRKYRDVAL